MRSAAASRIAYEEINIWLYRFGNCRQSDDIFVAVSHQKGRSTIPLHFTANVSISKGLSTILAQPKGIRLPLVVPSFLATPGTYKWSEVYKVEKDGKSEIFLKVSKPMIIALDWFSSFKDFYKINVLSVRFANCFKLSKSEEK